MDLDKLWTIRELATYLVYTESTIARMASQQSDRLPPRVSGLGKPRWDPEVVKQWTLKQSTGPIGAAIGRPRTVR